ncbi:MAG: hypothetical protein AAF483_30470, partial [Planctomycetota bacterium]
NPSQPVNCPECGTVIQTDEDGTFEFRVAEAELSYQLAIAAEDFEGKLVRFPGKNQGKLVVKLNSIAPEQSKKIEGRVLDDQGNPLRGVVILPYHIRYGNITTGTNNGLVSKLTLSDEDGKFTLFAVTKVVNLALRASGRGKATAQVQYSFDSKEDCEIIVGKGASLRGRLIFDGQPQAGVKLGIVQQDRSVGAIVTPRELVSNSDGEFVIDHLPPDREYALYTFLQQDAKAVLPASLVTAPGHGKRAELGDVPLQAASRLSIKIRAADKQELPEKSMLYVGQRLAWQVARFDPAGKNDPLFTIPDASEGSYDVTLRIPGYKVAAIVPTQSPTSPGRYKLNVDGDTNVAFVLVPEKEE